MRQARGLVMSCDLFCILSGTRFMRSANLNQPAGTLAQLLALHDQEFVQSAYLTLLGRAADPDGLRTYVQQVRAGERKIAIIAQLHRSAEGRAFAAELPGLSGAISAYRQSRWPVLGRLITALCGNEGNGAHERKLRSIENAVYAKANELLDKLDRLEVVARSRAAVPTSTAAGMPAMQEHIEHKVPSPASHRLAEGGFAPA